MLLYTGLLLFGVATTSVGANFIKKNPISTETVKEYDMQFSEHGANFTQRVILDKEHGFVIHDVPAHNDRTATKFIYDTKNGLMLEVINKFKTCSLHRAFYALSIEQMEANLEPASYEDNASEDRLDLNTETATMYDLTEIRSEEPIDLDCIPENLREQVPEGYTVYLSRQVHLGKENIHQSQTNESQRTIFDPMTQKSYKPGDIVELFEDVFKFLPNCPSLTRSSRVKRECRYPDGTLVPRCHGYRSIDGTTCPNGCDATDTGYDCDVTDFGCHMVIVCRVVQGAECIAHIGNNRNTCRRCCRHSNCGTYLNKCRYMGQSDVCPPAGHGCPVEDVDQSYSGPKTKKRCYIHPR